MEKLVAPYNLKDFQGIDFKDIIGVYVALTVDCRAVSAKNLRNYGKSRTYPRKMRAPKARAKFLCRISGNNFNFTF